MGTNFIRAMLLASASVTAAVGVAPIAAQAQEQRYDINIPAQQLGDAIRALGRSTRQTIVFDGAIVRGKRSVAVRGNMTPAEALDRMLTGSGLFMAKGSSGSLTVRLGNGQGGAELASSNGEATASSADKGVAEILVVGSQSQNVDIRRTEDDPQPYIVFDGEEIRRSGATSVEAFIATRVPANSGDNPASNQSSSSAFGSITGGINLRGLGVNQTLVLVDGRPRSFNIGAAGGAQATLRDIPLSAIERIEILPTTAGGIYGGSATGGVVNIILKRDYRGIQIDASYGNAFKSSVSSKQISLNGGVSLFQGNTRITGGYSKASFGTLLASDRDFESSLFKRVVANVPSAFPRTGPNLCSTAGTTGTACNGPLLVLDNGTPLGVTRTAIPIGYPGPVSSGDGGLGLLANAGEALFRDSPTVIWSSPKTTSMNVGLRQSIADSLEVYGSLYGSKSEIDRSIGTQAIVNLPGNAPNNPFQQNIVVSVPLPGVKTRSISSIKRSDALAGILIRLPHQWTASTEYTFSRYKGSSSLQSAGALSASGRNIVQSIALSDTTNFEAPVGTIFNAGLSESEIGGSTSQASFRAGGSAFELPGGTMKVTSLLQRQIDKSPLLASYTSAPTTSFSWPASQRSDSAYIEIMSPLVSNRNDIKFIKELQITTSIRYSHYKKNAHVPFSSTLFAANADVPAEPGTQSRVYSSTDFTVSGKYSPVKGVTLRASYGTGFLPPSFFAVVDAPAPVITILDGVLDPRRGNTPANVGQTFTTTRLVNSRLEPERSDSISVGLIAEPEIIRGLRVSLDYTKIRKTDEITSFSYITLIPLEQYFPDRVIRGAKLVTDNPSWAGPILSVDVSSANFAKTSLSSLDFQIDYKIESEKFGKIGIYAIGSWQLRYKSQATPLAPNLDLINNRLRGAPSLRANGGIDWQINDWTLSWNAQYYSGRHICLVEAGSAFCPSLISAFGGAKLKSEIYHDFSISHSFAQRKILGQDLKNIDISLSVQNLFNKSPYMNDPSLTTGLTNSGTVDPRLRRFSLGIRLGY